MAVSARATRGAPDDIAALAPSPGGVSDVAHYDRASVFGADKSDSSENNSVRVHSGQKVAVAGYKVEATGIERDVVRIQVGKSR